MRSRLSPLTSLALLIACHSSWKALDVDGDGYTPWDGDCWDAVEGPDGSGLSGADIHPGADDPMGDGVDQDCDGGLEYDIDGDGYDRVADGGQDCDDDDAEIHPDATEVCDDVDDDCDGLIDDDDPDLEPGDWYLDGDRDGYGGASAVVASCTPPDGYTDVGGDCDDGDPATYPDAPELCDGADNDCDDSIDEDPDDPTNSTIVWADEDDDGYGNPDVVETSCDDDKPTGYADNDEDCDDTDPDVNPAAVETCNNIDDDCNGATDDNPVEGTEYYPDADDDHYGDDMAAAPVLACSQPDGYVDNQDDCDDSDPEINPAAAEICNGIDDDCDGERDDADSSITLPLPTWYLDEDDDGYGQSDDYVESCSAPTGYVELPDDCDDANADSYPGAPEICASGVVEDCDGSAEDALEGCASGDIDASAADAERLGSYPSGGVGAALGRSGGVSVGDSGVFVGAPAYSSGAGEVYLLNGPLARSTATLSGTTVYDARRTGSSWSELGSSLAYDADVNGDGFADAIMGTPYYDYGSKTDAGAAYLEYGPLTGTTTISASRDSLLFVNTAGEHVGTAVAAGALLGMDGYADIAAGAPGFDAGSGKTEAGAIYFLEGPPTASSVDLRSYATYRVNSDGRGDKAGTALAAVGDMDGDGNADVLIGVPGDSDTASGAGKAALLLGPIDSSGTLADLAALTFRGTSASSAAGSAVASAGDTNGDGYDDLLVGGPGTSSSAGAAWLVLGDETSSLSFSVLATSADAILSGASGDEAGTSASGNFDINGDGNSEILIGGPGASSDAGVAWMFYGPITGTLTLSTDADVTISGESTGDALGTAVSGLGDTDGDGLDDLVVGAPGVDSSTLTDAGAVYLFALWY